MQSSVIASTVTSPRSMLSLSLIPLLSIHISLELTVDLESEKTDSSKSLPLIRAWKIKDGFRFGITKSLIIIIPLCFVFFKKSLFLCLLQKGTADAIRRCLWVFEEFPVTEFLVLPGHHLYKMNYKTLIEDHRRSRADITIVGLSSARDRDSGFGFMEVDSTNLVTRFTIKPEKDQHDFISVS